MWEVLGVEGALVSVSRTAGLEGLNLLFPSWMAMIQIISAQACTLLFYRLVEILVMSILALAVEGAPFIE